MGTCRTDMHQVLLFVHVGKVGEKGEFSKPAGMSRTEGLQTAVLKQCVQKSRHQHIPMGERTWV